jgi:hypothetical protein
MKVLQEKVVNAQCVSEEELKMVFFNHLLANIHHQWVQIYRQNNSVHLVGHLSWKKFRVVNYGNGKLAVFSAYPLPLTAMSAPAIEDQMNPCREGLPWRMSGSRPNEFRFVIAKHDSIGGHQRQRLHLRLGN